MLAVHTRLDNPWHTESECVQEVLDCVEYFAAESEINYLIYLLFAGPCPRVSVSLNEWASVYKTSLTRYLPNQEMILFNIFSYDIRPHPKVTTALRMISHVLRIWHLTATSISNMLDLNGMRHFLHSLSLVTQECAHS